MSSIKAIIGLGNPGQSYYQHRHSIGFRVLDALAERHAVSWRTRENMEVAELSLDDHKILLVKPQTYMNNSGAVIPWLKKQGIGVDDVLVVHDEIELPFGKLAFKKGGSAKGHNGLKSIIAALGDQFERLRFGVDRPAEKEQVPTYVLSNFSQPSAEVDAFIDKAITMLEERLQQ
jgi:PTH1 family peptidyl-tRNA hydrolase